MSVSTIPEPPCAPRSERRSYRRLKRDSRARPRTRKLHMARETADRCKRSHSRSGRAATLWSSTRVEEQASREETLLPRSHRFSWWLNVPASEAVFFRYGPIRAVWSLLRRAGAGVLPEV